MLNGVICNEEIWWGEIVMKELILDFDNKGPIYVNNDINIEANLNIKDEIEYKFIEGYNKVWTPIQDFSEKKICRWTPKNPGKYMILVQGKVKGSTKPYDYSARLEFDIIEDNKLINNVNMDKNKVTVGDKVIIDVEGREELLLYRFWVKNKEEWELLNDYSTDNKYIFTATEPGSKEILVECKKVNSTNNVDDYIRLKIDIRGLEVIEITDFKVLSNKMVVNEELIFKVETNHEENRPLLYKFVKINKEGKYTCVQDFSSKSIVSFKEEIEGEYKLLCYVRDIFSNKEYDDRALIVYDVIPYEKIKIRNFKADIESPQVTGTRINLEAVAEGGRELIYRYIIEGPVSEDSGYIRSNKYSWEPSEEGKYNITLKVKDISFKGDYESINSIVYNIDKKGDKPVRIVEVKCDKGRAALINQPFNINVKCEGGCKALYKFIVYKDGIQKEEMDYVKNNWINFVPKEKGEYEVEVRVKDLYSIKDFDSSTSIYIKCNDFIPANIDYVLTNNKEIYLVNDVIEMEAIIQNTTDTVVRFITKINGQEVEDTGYVENKAIRVKPKCPGKYVFNIYAKNIKSNEEYDSKKEVIIYVKDVMPVNSTKIVANKKEIKVGEEVTFEVNSKGGKDVCYEFYMMKEKNWVLVQEYSKKNYYTFLPFSAGQYRLLVLSKSFYKKINYEDYESITFNIV